MTTRTPTSTGRRGFVGVDRNWLADQRLTDSALRLMMWLESHTDEYLASLDKKRAAQEIGWSRDRVSRTLDSLTELGLVSTEQVHHVGSGQRTLITLHLDAWSVHGATRQGTPVPHGKAPSVPYGKAPTTSNPTVVGTHSQEQCTTDVVRPSLELVRRDDDTERFEQFWQLYGRTGPKKKARECWNRARTKATADEIIAGLKRWVEYWSTPGAASIKWPQGWLNEERWRDEPPFVALHIDRRNSQPQRDNGMGAIARRRQAQDR